MQTSMGAGTPLEPSYDAGDGRDQDRQQFDGVRNAHKPSDGRDITVAAAAALFAGTSLDTSISTTTTSVASCGH